MLALAALLFISPATPMTVAVVPTDSPKEYAPLAEAVTDYLMARLSEAQPIRLVERRKLDVAMGELGLAASGLTEGQALKLGKFVAAENLLFSSLTSPAPQTLILTARLLHIPTGRVVAAATVSGDTDKALDLTERLVGELLAKLNIRLKAKPLPKAIETVSDYRMAWLTGLGAFYTGQYAKAVAWLTKARKLDENNPTVVLMLLKAYLAMGQKEHALLELQRLRLLFPKSEEAKEGERLLKGRSIKRNF